MKNLLKHILLLLLLMSSTALMAQNSTASPYSRFGYGELNDNVPGAYRALGGVGTGMRQKTVINPSQPASYSVVDSTTFMFDLGASVQWSNYNDATGQRNRANGNLEYISLQFPIWKYIGLGLGVQPYSMVGYDFSLNDSINSDYHYTSSYIGQGSITQVYGGLSFNIMNWFAVGANVYYMFGTTTKTQTLSFTEATVAARSEQETMRVSDVRFRYGAQFFHTFGDHSIVLGGTFENKSKLNCNYQKIETTTEDSIATVNDGFELPMYYSAGASYNWRNRLMIAFDYSMTEWGKTTFHGQEGALRSRAKYAFGVEYMHNPLGKKYWEHIPFRAGCSVSDSYIKNLSAKDFTVSVGMGFPLRNVGTVINTTIEYGHRGTATQLQENYLKLTINASISEYWFFKRRL